MLVRSLICILILVSSCVLVLGQTNTKKSERVRDMPFGTYGIDLQFLIKELAREIDLNVLFDTESFRTPGRKTYIDLKNVTPGEALNYVLAQEKLISEDVGPKAIMIATEAQGRSIPQIGLSTFPMSEQLARFFGVEKGMLIHYVRPDWPAAKAGLKAGDVIVEVDGGPVWGALGVNRTLRDKNGGDVILKIVRDHTTQTVSVTPRKPFE